MVDRRSLSQKKRREILARQHGRCDYCGAMIFPPRFEIDHRQALIHGGDNEDDNLSAICFNCHKAKTRKDVHGRAHADRIAVGGKARKSRPMDGARGSRFKKHMDGRVSYR